MTPAKIAPITADTMVPTAISVSSVMSSDKANNTIVSGEAKAARSLPHLTDCHALTISTTAHEAVGILAL